MRHACSLSRYKLVLTYNHHPSFVMKGAWQRRKGGFSKCHHTAITAKRLLLTRTLYSARDATVLSTKVMKHCWCRCTVPAKPGQEEHNSSLCFWWNHTRVHCHHCCWKRNMDRQKYSHWPYSKGQIPQDKICYLHFVFFCLCVYNASKLHVHSKICKIRLWLHSPIKRSSLCEIVFQVSLEAMQKHSPYVLFHFNSVWVHIVVQNSSFILAPLMSLISLPHKNF